MSGIDMPLHECHQFYSMSCMYLSSIHFWATMSQRDCWLWIASLTLVWVYSPYLSVGGWSLSDDGAGLGRGQGLLDHYAGIVVAHPWVGMLVLALASLAVQCDVLGVREKQATVRNLEGERNPLWPRAAFARLERITRTYASHDLQAVSEWGWGNVESLT